MVNATAESAKTMEQRLINRNYLIEDAAEATVRIFSLGFD